MQDEETTPGAPEDEAPESAEISDPVSDVPEPEAIDLKTLDGLVEDAEKATEPDHGSIPLSNVVLDPVAELLKSYEALEALHKKRRSCRICGASTGLGGRAQKQMSEELKRRVREQLAG